MENAEPSIGASPKSSTLPPAKHRCKEIRCKKRHLWNWVPEEASKGLAWRRPRRSPFVAPCEHNLKNVDLTIPRDKLVVFTGLSGSGKSSLAFDTIYAEGQRRYVESLSAYARQFLEMMQKPDVDQIDGLFASHLHRTKNHVKKTRAPRSAPSPKSTTT